MEKHQQGKFSSLTFLNPRAKTRAASSPGLLTPRLVSDLSFTSELHTHSALAFVPHLCSASTRVQQHFMITKQETLASPEATPALQPLPVASLASSGPPHPALALVSPPVGYRVRRSEHVPQVHFIWLSYNTKLDSPVCMPFVSSNTCLKRQESQNSLSLHSTGTPCCHSTGALDHSTSKLQKKTLISGLQRKYPSSYQAPHPQTALKTKLLKILGTP